MLKYLIIPLHDNAVSFCHYPSARKSDGKWIDASRLREAIRYAMLENLNIQFVYPDQETPAELKEIINTIDHTDIVGNSHEDPALKSKADVVVFDSIGEMKEAGLRSGQAYVLRLALGEWMENHAAVAEILNRVDRLSVVFTDVVGKSDEELKTYGKTLESLVPVIVEAYKRGHQVQLNLLTDRIMLEKMNNCNAGWESVTLAPDGKFYICPAFSGDEREAVGTLEKGPEIKNPQLYRLDYAPICRKCDAYQCRRCVWLNRQLTLEVNTPGHEQCVMAHHERNASRVLLEELRNLNPTVLPQISIPAVDYLDPFDKIIEK